MTDFIETYDNALDKNFCLKLIEKFEKSKRKKPGFTGQGLNQTAKASTDITISLDSDWYTENHRLEKITMSYLVDYMRKYDHLLTGAISLFIQDPASGKPMAVSREIIKNIEDNSVFQMINSMYRLGNINLQKY